MNQGPVSEQGILPGHSPWSALTGSTNAKRIFLLKCSISCSPTSGVCIYFDGRSSVNIQQKMEVVSASNCMQHLQEEEALIVQEMVRCLQFVRKEINDPLTKEINGRYMIGCANTLHVV